MRNFRYAVLSAAVVAATAAANAQTTIITREPAQTQTIVTTEPLQLTPVQRQTIYRTIVREPIAVAPPPTVEYRVGMRVPENVRLYSVPQSVAVEVPAVSTYKYMMVNDRLFLVDPATSQVVAEFTQ